MNKSTVIIDDIKADYDSWLELKKTTIGSSEIATLAGLNKYMSPLELWLEKTGQVERSEESLSMTMGKLKEPIIAHLWAQKTGNPVYQNIQCFQLDSAPWVIATPDYYADIEEERASFQTITEIKNVDSYSRSDWFSSDTEAGEIDNTVPDYAHCQVIWQMGISGIHRCRVVALIGDRELITRIVPFDQALFEALLHMAVKFKDQIDTMTPPNVEARDVVVVRDMFQRSGESIELDHNSADMIMEWVAAHEERSRLNKLVEAESLRMKLAEAGLRMDMKGSELGVYGPYVIRCKESTVKGHYRKESHRHSFKIVATEDYSDMEN